MEKIKFQICKILKNSTEQEQPYQQELEIYNDSQHNKIQSCNQQNNITRYIIIVSKQNVFNPYELLLHLGTWTFGDIHDSFFLLVQIFMLR